MRIMLLLCLSILLKCSLILAIRTEPFKLFINSQDGQNQGYTQKPPSPQNLITPISGPLSPEMPSGSYSLTYRLDPKAEPKVIAYPHLSHHTISYQGGESIKDPYTPKIAPFPGGRFIYSYNEKMKSRPTKIIHILITSISSYLIYPIRGGPIEGYSKQA
jgi:hypothetical protein